jgi:SAM-dependent methyltransferase
LGHKERPLGNVAHALPGRCGFDASSETLDLNRQRVGRADVEYVVADLFSWTPTRAFDVVCFSFWLSHVPRTRFSWFWDLVHSCLAPGGRVFFIDNRDDPQPTTADNDPYVVHYGPDLHLRRLSDGSEYRVVKVMYEPEDLQSLLEQQGGPRRSKPPAGSSSAPLDRNPNAN